MPTPTPKELTDVQKLAAEIVSNVWPHHFSLTLNIDAATARSLETAKTILSKVKQDF